MMDTAISIDDLRIKGKIGEGTYSMVRVARYRNKRGFVAVKYQKQVEGADR